MARSTFRSQNVQNTPCMDHFWKLRCLKSARRCGAKHISKSKCTKHTMYGPFLEVQMSFRVVGARDFGPCQKSAKREGFVAFSTTTTTTHTTLQYITLHYNYNYTFTTFYYTTLHYTTLHSITLNYTTLHYTTLHYTTLHYTTLHYATLHYTTTTTAHSISRNDGRRGAFEEDLQRCISRGRCSTKTCSSEMFGGQGAHFLKGLRFGVSDLQVC